MAAYSPATIEPKWQSAWKDLKVFNSKIDLAKKKYFVLGLFMFLLSGNFSIFLGLLYLKDTGGDFGGGLLMPDRKIFNHFI